MSMCRTKGDTWPSHSMATIFCGKSGGVSRLFFVASKLVADSTKMHFVYTGQAKHPPYIYVQ